MSATFRSPSSAGIPAQRPQSSGAIPAVRPPDSLPAPPLPGPPSPLPPAPSPPVSSLPPVEAPPAEKSGLLDRIPPRARLPIAIGLGLLAVIIAIRIVVRPKPAADDATDTPQTTTGPATPTDDVASDLIPLDVVGLPPGAVVRLDGLPAATMPMRVRRGSHHVLTVTAPGYVQRSIELTVTEEMHVPADLRPLIGTQ